MSEVRLTDNQRDAMDSLAWGEWFFGSLTPTRTTQRRVIEALVAKGLAESVGVVAMCDDDGFLVQPERYREGFRLTDEGLKRADKERSRYADKLIERRAAAKAAP